MDSAKSDTTRAIGKIFLVALNVLNRSEHSCGDTTFLLRLMATVMASSIRSLSRYLFIKARGPETEDSAKIIRRVDHITIFGV